MRTPGGREDSEERLGRGAAPGVVEGDAKETVSVRVLYLVG